MASPRVSHLAASFPRSNLVYRPLQPESPVLVSLLCHTTFLHTILPVIL
jgi:hypothetical protein